MEQKSTSFQGKKNQKHKDQVFRRILVRENFEYKKSKKKSFVYWLKNPKQTFSGTLESSDNKHHQKHFFPPVELPQWTFDGWHKCKDIDEVVLKVFFSYLA